MATYTSYLNLKKPTTSENYSVLDWNNNMDKIDAGVSALNSNLNAIATTNTFTVKLYDNETYIRDLENVTGRYWDIGHIRILSIYGNNPDLSNVSTLIAFRELPSGTYLGGCCYEAKLASSKPLSLQGGSRYLYLRPNVVSSDFADPTSTGSFQLVAFAVI